MIRNKLSSTKSDSIDRNDWNQTFQAFSKIAICIGIWHRFDLPQALINLNSSVGFYLFSPDS